LSARTAASGLFLFVPPLEGIDLKRVVEAGDLPGSKQIPAERAVRSLLALKLLGTERKSHVMDLVFDPAIALFAGLNAVPKATSRRARFSAVVAGEKRRHFSRCWPAPARPAVRR